MNNHVITILNRSVEELLLSMQKVPGSILGQVYLFFAYCHMLQLHLLLSAVYDALINWCLARAT